MNNIVILIILCEYFKKKNEYYILFDDYLLGKKIRLLYRLYNQIYGFVVMEQNIDIRNNYNIYIDEDTGYCIAELKGTEYISLSQRLNQHKIAYKKLKAQHKKLKFLENGIVSLFSYV